MKRILKWIFRIVLVLLILAFLFVFVAYWRSTNDCNRQTAAPANPMKAIVRCDYGPANLKLAEIEKPAPDDDQILVKVLEVDRQGKIRLSRKEAMPAPTGTDATDPSAR